MTGTLVSGGVTLVGVGQNEYNLTFVLASGLAETDIGSPVTKDTSGNNQVKKSADGDLILGILESYESDVQTGLKRGMVSLTGGYRLTYKTGDAVAVGDSVVSAGSGEVKTTGTANRTTVFSKDTTNRTVDVLLAFIC